MKLATEEIFINNRGVVYVYSNKKITEMVDMLPQQEQNLAYEMIKRIVLAWDPDYTKLTKDEAKDLVDAYKDDYIDEDDIDWDHLEKYK